MHDKKRFQKKSNVELNPSDERLRSYALWMLGRQDYTENKLREKMRLRFPESTENIELAINVMKDMDYINDERYVQRLSAHFVESGELGPSAIRSKLYQKGFKKEDIEDAMSQDCVAENDFFESALSFKVKHYGELPISEPKEKQRALGKLVRKGFNFQDALKAIESHPDDIF